MYINEKKIIFVTGASRSGTTLLSTMLTKNTEIFSLNELHYFGDIWTPSSRVAKVSEAKLLNAAESIFSRQQFGVMSMRTSQEARSKAQEVVASLPAQDRTYPGVFVAAISRLTDDAGKRIPCLQTPRKIFYAETLLQLFPQAQVIHMLRDPRGVMASQKQRWRRRSLAADKNSLPLMQMLRVWVNYHPYTVTEMWLQATRIATQLAGHERFMVVRFEDLLESPRATLIKICDRLKIRFDPAMLGVSQVNSSYQSSAGGARKGINKSAIDSWRAHLTPGEVAITEARCHSLMLQFGYISESTRQLSVVEALQFSVSYLLHLIGVVVVNPRRAWIQVKAILAGSKL